MSKSDELIQAVGEGGERLESACLARGLLIERRRTNHPNGDDGGVRHVPGDEIADLQLTEADALLPEQRKLVPAYVSRGG
jgi:hypothetical protein